jgi:hypothetical protein
MRKAQALSMNTIIIAALALLVLAIISLLFIGRMNTTNQDINSCENNGGRCMNLDSYGVETCGQLANDPGWVESSQYSVGRNLRSYRCYDQFGEVKPDFACCAFS